MTETRYTSPDRTEVTDGAGWAATFTDNCRTVTVRGPERTFTEHLIPFADGFDREITDGFGSCPAGGIWYCSGGASTDYQVVPGTGKLVTTTANVSRRATVSNTIADLELNLLIESDKLAVGASQAIGAVMRYQDANNMYLARILASTSNTVSVDLRRRLAGTETTLATVASPTAWSADTPWHIRCSASGNVLSAKAWRADLTEPPTWMVTATDTSFTSGRIGIRAISNTGTSNLPVTYSIHSLNLVTGTWPSSFTPSVTHARRVHLLDTPFTGTVDYTWLNARLDVDTPDMLTVAMRYVGGGSIT